ncbi:hypothetical protein HYG87_01795 [Methanobacterium alkalithermotolerans]|uniref:Histidine kinase domain-containing protein n=1 Tax=Methanobacterium alkalithermotolerans TaxID=2731220 RepID=A0A8T8K2D0_9EURY|nr:histidine kinase dimerization/phosphoacceptor domain -containing protein [Methanobacterium alkalithermotolerans]QUH22588.1 hypothetical protein HYG87_01795 [Methanobacterium alkalithermotolerans]
MKGENNLDAEIYLRRIIISKKVSQILSLLVIFMGFMVILGWFTDINILTGDIFNSPPSKFITALLSVICGFLVLILNRNISPLIKRFIQLVSLFIFFIGFLFLIQYLTGMVLPTDYLPFINSPYSTLLPGRSRFMSSFNFILYGIIIFLFALRKRIVIGQSLSILTGLIGFMGFTTYFYGLDPSKIPEVYTEMALYTAFTHLLLSSALLCLYPQQGLMKYFTQEYTGNFLSRKVLPVGILSIIGLGFIVLYGMSSDLFSSSFAVVIMVNTSIFILVLLIIGAAEKLSDLDKERINYQQSLEESLEEQKTIQLELENIVIEKERAQQKLRKLLDEKEIIQSHLESSLSEKETLIREIHHRVKNNLQIISSLLSLQRGYVEDEYSLDLLHEAQTRVKSMALVHEKLYRSEELSHINMQHYVDSLTRDLLATYSQQGVDLNLDLDEVKINIETAIPLGLIINELVSNSLKYAFKGVDDGKIDLSLKECTEGYQLIVKDNGAGLPPALDLDNPKTLGLQLVQSLVGQLDGQLEVFNADGVSFKITFKELLYDSR